MTLEKGSKPEGMYYCGPALHTLFISSTRMAGDDDFIKSGKVGGWVGGKTGILTVYVCVSFFVPFPIQYVHEFQYMFSNRYGKMHEMENQSVSHLFSPLLILPPPLQ